MNYRLKNRYILEGKIIMETGLHLGGGLPEPRTDSSILRTIDGKPFIPGSSFKGAFRSAVERIVPAINPSLKSCGLAFNEPFPCITVNKILQDKYKKLIEDGNDKSKQLDFLKENLCHTCKLFGSPYNAGRVFFSDLYLSDVDSWIDKTEVRDGVVIDRDSERAVPHLKYDYEVLPAGISFDFSITMENVNDYELGLVATGIQEFKNGMIPMGGIKSRGLGRCVLKILNIRYVDFEDKESLKDYLIKGKDGMKQLENYERFFSDKIAHLFSEDVNYIC